MWLKEDINNTNKETFRWPSIFFHNPQMPKAIFSHLDSQRVDKEQYFIYLSLILSQAHTYPR